MPTNLDFTNIQKYWLGKMRQSAGVRNSVQESTPPGNQNQLYRMQKKKREREIHFRELFLKLENFLSPRIHRVSQQCTDQRESSTCQSTAGVPWSENPCFSFLYFKTCQPRIQEHLFPLQSRDSCRQISKIFFHFMVTIKQTERTGYYVQVYYSAPQLHNLYAF